MFFLKLSDGKPKLSRAQWEKACGLGTNHSQWTSSSHGHEHEIASLLFHAADLSHSDSIEFEDFTILAVTSAAAHEGDHQSQLELIWLLLDKEETFAQEEKPTVSR